MYTSSYCIILIFQSHIPSLNFQIFQMQPDKPEQPPTYYTNYVNVLAGLYMDIFYNYLACSHLIRSFRPLVKNHMVYVLSYNCLHYLFQKDIIQQIHLKTYSNAMHLSLYQIKVYSHNSTYNNFYIYYNHTLQTIYCVIWQIAHLIFFICTTLQKRAELQIVSFHFLCHMFYLSWCYHNCPSLHINIFTISNFTTVIIKNTPEQKSWSVIYFSETS